MYDSFARAQSRSRFDVTDAFQTLTLLEAVKMCIGTDFSDLVRRFASKKSFCSMPLLYVVN